jgi:hypothetical protein
MGSDEQTNKKQARNKTNKQTNKQKFQFQEQ